MGNKSELLTTKEVAKLVNAEERTIWRWSRSGIMPAPVKIGAKAVRFRRADITDWVDQGCPMVAA